MSQSETGRKFFLNRLKPNIYYEHLRTTPRLRGGDITSSEATTNFINDTNYYISTYIENQSDLTEAQKYKRYKELYSIFKETTNKIPHWLSGNTRYYTAEVDTNNTILMPLKQQIKNKIKELKPPPEAEPLVNAEVAGVPERQPLGIVDRFRSMFGRPEEIQAPLVEAQVVNTIPTTQAEIIPTTETQLTNNIPTAQFIPAPPSSSRPSFRRPIGGGAAPEDTITFV